MTRIAGNVAEQFVIGLGEMVASIGARQPVAEPSGTAEEHFQSAPISCTGETPPGRRSITELRDDCGLVHCVESVCWEAVVPQGPHGEQDLAHEARRWSTCSDTENLRLKVTSRILMVSTRGTLELQAVGFLLPLCSSTGRRQLLPT